MFAKLCRIAYKKNNRIIEECEKMGFSKENIDIIEEGTMKCFVVRTGLRQYVIFKGTSTPEEVMIDLTALPFENGITKGKVHSGVWTAAMKFYVRLKLTLDNTLYTYFVGHSLGAGLAAYTACMLYAKNNLFLIKEIICIGSFKLGNNEFAEWLTRRINVTLIQNNMDIICNILQKPYIQVANTHYYFDRNEKLIENPTNNQMFWDRMLCYIQGRVKELAKDHTSESYYNVLKAVDL
jgi:hypothetical protein